MSTLKSVFELWNCHQQMMVVLVDKMLKTQIVECAAVANWLFSREMVKEFTKAYSWEILHLTIRKMNKHVNKLSKEASDARKMINDESESDSEDSDMETGENKNRNGERKRHSNKSGEKPSEDQVEKLEERLEAAQADQKNLFLIIFQVKATFFPNYFFFFNIDDNHPCTMNVFRAEMKTTLWPIQFLIFFDSFLESRILLKISKSDFHSFSAFHNDFV